MRQGLTLPELAARVRSEQERKRDIVADTRTMSTISNGVTRLQVDDEDGVSEYDVTEHAHGQIADRIGVPKRYYDRMRQEAPALLDQNVNHWLHQKPERRMLRTFRPFPGATGTGAGSGIVRGFVSDRYRRLDYSDLLAHVMPIFGELGVDNGSVVSCNLSDTRMYLKVVFPGVLGDVKPGLGDIVQAGVVLSNSEVGAGALRVEPLVYRLACLNGMVVADKTMVRYHVGRRIEDTEEAMAVFSDATLRLDDQALFAKVADVVKACANQAAFALIVDRLRDLADKRITTKPLEAVQVLAKKATLTEDESASILQHLIEGGDLTAWGYLNAVTRASQDCEEYERATDLERLGGQILADPALVLA
jgi:hypothetical protein